MQTVGGKKGVNDREVNENRRVPRKAHTSPKEHSEIGLTVLVQLKPTGFIRK